VTGDMSRRKEVKVFYILHLSYLVAECKLKAASMVVGLKVLVDTPVITLKSFLGVLLNSNSLLPN